MSAKTAYSIAKHATVCHDFVRRKIASEVSRIKRGAIQRLSNSLSVESASAFLQGAKRTVIRLEQGT
jgi:hypothetical protein